MFRARRFWVDGVEHKICNGPLCLGKLLPVEAFFIRKSATVKTKAGSFRTPCKKCTVYKKNLWGRKNSRRASRHALAWRARNPDKAAAQQARRRKLIREAPGGPFDLSRPDYQARLDELGRKCFWCGGPFQSLDHLVPLSRNGTHYPSNVVPSCLRCNSSKKAKTPEEWTDRPYLRKQTK